MPRKGTGGGHSCDICDWKFTRKYDLNRHMNIHSPDVDNLKFKCPFENCKYASLQQCNLKTHITSVHLKEKNYQCNLDGCKKAYGDGAALSRHKKNAHISSQKTRKTGSHTKLAKEIVSSIDDLEMELLDSINHFTEDTVRPPLPPSLPSLPSYIPERIRSASPFFPSPMTPVHSLPMSPMSESYESDASSHKLSHAMETTHEYESDSDMYISPRYASNAPH